MPLGDRSPNQGNQSLPPLAVVVSEADEASKYIGERLRVIADWMTREDESRSATVGGGTYHRLPADAVPSPEGKRTAARPVELRTFEDLHIRMSDPVPAFSDDPVAVVFASRHSGETGPLLTCHHTGNFGPAEFGGSDRSFAPAAPGLQRAVLTELSQTAPAEYDIGIECTHHGPTDVSAPALFVELGSGPDEWRDQSGAEAVARAILRAADAQPTVDGTDTLPRQLFGIGGGHYAPRFERVLRETPWGVGHIASDWQVDELGDPARDTAKQTLRRALEASNTPFVLIDGTEPDVEAALADLDVRVVSETWVREVSDRSLELVRELETALSSVDDGLRFGRIREESFETVALPDRLLQAARTVDADRTRELIAARTLAFETVDNGSRAKGRAAFPCPGFRSDLIDELVTILNERYDTVDRYADEVVARESAFDPELATARGVPEGPAFGKLANGEAVQIDGERIEPDDVVRTREDHFPL